MPGGDGDVDPPRMSGASGKVLRDELGVRAVSDGPLNGSLGGVFAAVPGLSLKAVVVLADVLVELADDRAEHLDGRLRERLCAVVVRLERLVDMRQAEPVAGQVPLPDNWVAQPV